MVVSQQVLTTGQTQVTSLDQLSDHYHLNQKVQKTSMRRKLAWTTTCYHGMNQKTWTSAQQVYRRHCKKPTLFSRISLGTLKGRGRRYSIATDQSHNFRHLSGSIYSAEMPLTSTMSSQTSTHYPTAQAMLSNLGKTLNCSMDRQHQPKPSRLTEIGSSLGTVWSKPHSSYSNTESRNSSPTESTSSVISHRYLPNSTVESSTMIELPTSEQPSAEPLNFRTTPSSQTCRSSGSPIFQLPLVQVKPQNLPRNLKSPLGR